MFVNKGMVFILSKAKKAQSKKLVASVILRDSDGSWSMTGLSMRGAGHVCSHEKINFSFFPQRRPL